jgi:hypothetical protein
MGVPCSCIPASATNATLVPDVMLNGGCAADTANKCMGTRILYEQALACTFLEGLIFMLICITGVVTLYAVWGLGFRRFVAVSVCTFLEGVIFMLICITGA